MRSLVAAAVLLAVLGLRAGAHLGADEAVAIFDGRTLTGWDGDPAHWRVEGGLLIGEATASVPLKRNSFIIWRGGTVRDCEISLSYRIMSAWANSGIQYRSKDLGGWLVAGYQANIESGARNGMNYSEETGRDVLSNVGERAWVGDGRTKRKVERIAPPGDLLASVKGRGEWNRYRLVARGATMTIFINDLLFSETIDESARDAVAEGIVALQLHAGQPMTIQFKDILVRTLTPR